MLEMLKKTMLTGFGLALKTREEMEDFANDWTNRQKMSEEDGRKFFEDLMKKYDSSRDNLEERVEEIVKKVLKKANIAGKEEVDELRAEIARLKSLSLSEKNPQNESGKD